jgi:hypothetical protein
LLARVEIARSSASGALRVQSQVIFETEPRDTQSSEKIGPFASNRSGFCGHKAMDGRGSVGGRQISHAAQSRNEAASMDASKKSGVGL